MSMAYVAPGTMIPAATSPAAIFLRQLVTFIVYSATNGLLLQWLKCDCQNLARNQFSFERGRTSGSAKSPADISKTIVVGSGTVAETIAAKEPAPLAASYRFLNATKSA